MHNIDENEVLRDALSGLNEDVPSMPENLHAAWMQKVEDAMNETRTEKTRTLKTLTRWLSVAAAVVFVFGGTLLTRDSLNGSNTDTAAQAPNTRTIQMKGARGAIPEETEDAAYSMDTSTNQGVMLTMARGSNTNGAAIDTDALPAATEKKIIRTASMTIVTQTYDDSLNALKSSCQALGGWVEQSSESVNSYSDTRTIWMTLRIPQDALDAYLAGTENLGRVITRSESAQDVTASYQDMQTRLDTQLALMERLQALITESADLSDLLALESQIADTQYQIDSLQTALNQTDRQVAYATVTITLQEEQTVQLTDTTVPFGERIVSAIRVGWEGLMTFLGDVVVFLVAASPLILIAAAAVILIRLIRKRRKSS